MKEKLFKEILKMDKFQVFIFASRMPFPLTFAYHSWIVINKKGKLDRWESGEFYKPEPKRRMGNVYLGLFNNDPLVGMNTFPFIKKIRNKSFLIDYISGNKNSTAEKMIKFIEKKSKDYPYKNIYKLIGPNSNTYPQWIINKFPEAQMQLPFLAIGKNYKENK